MLNITGDDEAVNSSCGCARDAHSSSLSLRLSRNGFSREFSTRSHGRLHRKTNFRSVCWEKLYWIVGNHPTRLKLLPSNFRGYQLISAMTFQSSEHVGNSIRVLNYSWTIERQPLRVSAFNMNSDKSFKFYSNRISTMHDVSWNRTYPASVELNFIIHVEKSIIAQMNDMNMKCFNSGAAQSSSGEVSSSWATREIAI